MFDTTDNFQEKRKQHLLLLKRKQLVRIVVVCIVWVVFFTYLVLPISRVNKVSLTGNVFLSYDDVLKISKIDSDTIRWDFDEKESNDLLNNYKLGEYQIIENSSVNVGLFSSRVSIKEIFPIGIVGDRVLLSSGVFVNEEDIPSSYMLKVGTIPLLNVENVAEFVEYNKKIDSSFADARKEYNLTSISDASLFGLTEKIYLLSFNIMINNSNITIKIYVDGENMYKKINIKNLGKIEKDIIEHPTYVVSNEVIVQFQFNRYSFFVDSSVQ